MNLSAIWPKEAPPIDEAKKFLEKYKNTKIVLKYGGQVMASLKLSKAFAEDAAICNKIGINTVVVHGGGPQIQQRLNQNKIINIFALLVYKIRHERWGTTDWPQAQVSFTASVDQ